MADILFPVGRMIGGSLAKLFPSTDNKGNPKLKADGTPQMRVNFGVAILKNGEDHWARTPWGALIWAAGTQGFPKGEYNAPTFAWKVIDGDSQIPNKKGNRPCDQTGYPGCWVIWFSQSWLPKKTNSNGTQELTDPEAIQAGYYVQVYASAEPNMSTESPGVYLNPIAVALSGYGERIATDVDTTKVGFGGALPPGASPVPIGMTGPPVGGPPARHDMGEDVPLSDISPATDFLNGPQTGGKLTYPQFIKKITDAGYTFDMAKPFITPFGVADVPALVKRPDLWESVLSALGITLA